MESRTAHRHQPLTRTLLVLLGLAGAEVKAVDLDGNGIDDLYAARFGVVGVDSAADLDGDGFTLLEESFFETDPTDRVDRPEIRFELLGSAVRMEWSAKGGVAYTLLQSDDLDDWFPFGPQRIGSGSVLAEQVEAEEAAEFFRLRAQPLDTDQDGLRDIDEESLGTDPLNGDSDGDGLGDGFEAADPVLDPSTAVDPCLDNNGNGVPDIEDYAATLGASVVSWDAAGDGDWNTASNWNPARIPEKEDVVLISPCTPGGPVVTVSADAQARAVLGNGSLLIENADFALGSLLSLQALTVRNNASLQPLGNSYVKLRLTVGGDLTVDAGSVIQVDNAGYPVREGPGAPFVVTRAGTSGSAGSHGGRGGRGRFTEDAELGTSYGSITQPCTLGSGANRRQGAGGGALRIQVGGTLDVDGSLRADAVRDGSAGAGGSVWIDCATLTGAGTISAVGGDGATSSGAGGGGRIAVYYDDSTFAGTMQARSGLNGIPGGAGSIFTKRRSETRGILTYSNANLPRNAGDGLTPIQPNQLVLEADLIVTDGAIVSSVPQETLQITTSGTVTIGPNSALDVTGQGFPGGSGPGVGEFVDLPGTGAIGGSHGGQGGTGRLITDRTKLGAVYGSLTEPVEFGSGSNRGDPAGGGALRLQCSALGVEGLIAASGEGGGGSGAGGSVWISCADLSGGGTIQANGGLPGVNSGGGGGGRVAIYYDSSNFFSGTIEARADSSGAGTVGGAGSVYLKQSGAPRALLRYDNGGASGGLTPLVGSRLTLDADLEIDGGARLSGLLGEPLLIDIPGKLTLHGPAFIDLTARGHGPFQGPGASTKPDPTQRANGASHAALGGRGWLVDPPSDSSIYGSITSPDQFGSGATGWGGGGLRLIVNDLALNGEILANGEPKRSPLATGSGGSIWITCNALSGSGKLAANGGTVSGPQLQLGGGGAGGRIAVFSNNSTFSGRYEATSATENPGGAGTIYLDTAGVDTLIVDNGGVVAAEATILPRRTALAGDFIVRGGGRVSRLQDIPDPILEVIAHGDVEIAADSLVDYSSQPLGSQVDFSVDPPTLPDEPTKFGGGSHGGGGGYQNPPTIVTPDGGSYEYDSPYNPRMPGSGPRAGGVVTLTAGGTLLLEGTIAANAGDAPQLNNLTSSGSSGGSILLSAETIEGEGILSAVGGLSHAGNPDVVMGGGGGGRIAIYGRTVSDQFTIELAPGNGDAFIPGQHGTGGNPGFPGTFVRACFPLNPNTGTVREIAPPSDLRADKLESATGIFMFPEHLTFAYHDKIGGLFTQFEAVDPGTYDRDADLVAALTAKDIWTTYLLHADPPAGSTPTLTASVTFDRIIIGVIATENGIDESNRWLGSQVPGAGGFFTASDGLELDSGDSFTISPDRRTLTVTFDTSDGLDQLRVVTQPRDLHEWCP